MQYIFAAIGGSGSTYLIDSLRRRYEVGARPDTAFRSSAGLFADGSKADPARFEAASGGYRIAPNAALREVLPGYLDFLRASDTRTAVFNTCAELRLFSELEVEHVVFLVRHPLHAYASWSKPERHGPVLEQLGGASSSRALEYYAARWRATIAEMQHLDRLGILGGVIRFEHARADAEPLGLSWVFDRFDQARRNAGLLPPHVENQLRSLVEPQYTHVYPTWDCISDNHSWRPRRYGGPDWRLLSTVE